MRGLSSQCLCIYLSDRKILLKDISKDMKVIISNKRIMKALIKPITSKRKYLIYRNNFIYVGFTKTNSTLKICKITKIFHKEKYE